MNIVFFVNDCLDPKSGVGQKICSQIKAFKSLAKNVYSIRNTDKLGTRVVNDEINIREDFCFHHYLLRYKFKNILKYILSINADLVYVRYTHFSSPAFIWFLRCLKKHSIKVILEFPTFPYDHEYKNLKFPSKLKLILDKIFRSKLSGYVDFCVSFTQSEEKIFGIPVIELSNAIDSSLVCSNLKKLDDIDSKPRLAQPLVFTAVASMFYWHGYDRFINAIYEYRKKHSEEIGMKFNIVGDGPELSKLKKLAKRLGVNDVVYFHGHLTGSRLAKILLASHVGVDSLGRFRSGNKENNSLKSKEYLAFGLPVIKSHTDSSIDDLDLHFNVTDNEDKLDLELIINWYTANVGIFNRKEIAKIVRNKFTWEVQMNKLLSITNKK